MEFKGFNKISRLFRDVVITEKIDGTNGIVSIEENGTVWAGSRTRWLYNSNEGMLGDDNFAFAHFVKNNLDELRKLGVGTHFGEWWGSGIQRGYGLEKGEKRFSLFNTHKWSDESIRPKCCSVVPVLYKGIFDTYIIQAVLNELKIGGSKASPGFMDPEGIVTFHSASGQMFKTTILNDEKHKGE